MIARPKPINIATLYTSPDKPNHFYLLPYQNHKQWVVQTKYHLNLSRIKLVVEAIVENLPEEIYDLYPLESDWCIVPIPLHWQTRITRRFDLNHIIAKKLSRRLGYKVTKPLRNISRTKQGDCTSKAERIKNAQNKFKLKTKAKVARNVILFDDVVATGATLKNCEKLLRSTGAKNFIWLSIAH